MIAIKSYKTTVSFENNLNGGKVAVYLWRRNGGEGFSTRSMLPAVATENWTTHHVINKHSAYHNEYHPEYWVDTTLLLRPLRMELFV